MENLNDEAALGLLSEINSKVDIVVSVVKANQQVQTKIPVETIKQPSITKEEINEIVNDHVQNLSNTIDQKNNQEVEKLDNINNGIAGLKRQLEQQPPKENLTLEDIAGLFPKSKKIAFFGHEFLRTSVVIFSLSLLLFWSAVMNVKQADKYRLIKYYYAEQSLYIQQMQSAIEKQKDTKEKDSVKKKKSQ